MDHRSFDARWEIALADARARIRKLGFLKLRTLLDNSNHDTLGEAEELAEVDLSNEIARYNKLLEEGEKRLRQFSPSPQTMLKETLFCGLEEGVPLRSVRGVTQLLGLRKVGVRSKHTCQIL